MAASEGKVDQELSMASRAAWLSYVGGYRQEDIAVRLGVSRPKVNRLIALAHRRGMIRIFVEGDGMACERLGEGLARHFGLDFCDVVPTLADEDVPLRSLGNGGARFLLRALDRSDLTTIGIGHGRTLAALVGQLPRLPRSDVQFVSLLGGLTRNAAANPFDVMHRLASKSSGEAYFMPVPLFANTVDDKQVLMAQKGVCEAFARAREAQLSMVGVGEIGPSAHMRATGMITLEEYAELSRAGAVGEVLGHFVDAEGAPVDVEINRLALGMKFDDLRGKDVVAVAGGRGKAVALRAVLRSGVFTGLITDEATARSLAESVGMDIGGLDPPVDGARVQPREDSNVR